MHHRDAHHSTAICNSGNHHKNTNKPEFLLVSLCVTKPKDSLKPHGTGDLSASSVNCYLKRSSSVLKFACA